jgi:transcriptional regulator with AAA-type ATPase domain
MDDLPMPSIIFRIAQLALRRGAWLTPEATPLREYHWPGNIRELRNKA